METSTTLSGALILALKWLFPSLIGAMLAVWYKKDDVDWNSKTTSQKFTTSFVGLFALIIGVTLSYAMGSAVIEIFNISVFGFQLLIYFGFGLSSLKILDAVVKNIDPILDIITSGVKDVVKGVVDSIAHKWRK